VGAILGIGLLNQQVNVTGLGKIVACWVGTPVGGMLVAIIAYKVLAAVYNNLNINLFESDILIRICLVIAGSYAAYALGANNVANVTAVFVGAGHLSVFGATLIGGLSIALGIMTFSRRVMETVGKRIVRLDPFSAFIVVFAEGITVHLYTFIGVPVSTSHALVGAILGVGIIKGINTVSRSTLLNILLGWLLTPVFAALITLCIAFVVQLQYIPGL
jgi:PiT family inorganic phosphate transporter